MSWDLASVTIYRKVQPEEPAKETKYAEDDAEDESDNGDQKENDN